MNAVAGSAGSGFWEPKRTLTLSAARGHTRFIKAFRLLMIVLAGALLVTLTYFMFDGPAKEDMVTNEAEMVRMTNPRYSGSDGDGSPYSLTADYAVRARDDVNLVRLVNPVLSFLRMEGVETSSIIAKEGIYDSKNQSVDLRTDVTVKTDDGYLCETSHARIMATDKTVEGDEPIFCTGDFGQVRGDTYQILESYSRFIFTGNVKGKIVPESENDIEGGNAP